MLARRRPPGVEKLNVMIYYFILDNEPLYPRKTCYIYWLVDSIFGHIWVPDGRNMD